MRVRDGLLDLADGLARVQVLRARLTAVHDRVAPVQFERVVQRLQSFLAHVIPGVLDPPVRLHQDGRTQVAIGVPPVRRTRRATTSTKDALVHPIQLLPVDLCL